MKRQLVWLTLIIALIVVFVVMLKVTGDPINEGNYNRISRGMSGEEVYGLLGRKADENIKAWDLWDGKNLTIWIEFDEQGLVLNKKRIGKGKYTFFDRIRDWLGLH